MVCCDVMLSVIVSQVGVSRGPVVLELVLRLMVLEPVEFHVHCFGFLLLDSTIDNAIGGAVVGSDRYGRMSVTKLDEN